MHTMINKTTGLSKGYGFVSYSSRDEAKAAITAMDGFRVCAFHCISYFVSY